MNDYIHIINKVSNGLTGSLRGDMVFPSRFFCIFLHKVRNGPYLYGTTGLTDDKKISNSSGIFRRSSDTMCSPFFFLDGVDYSFEYLRVFC